MPPPVMSKPSKAAHMAIAYVTLGSLLMVWSAIWYFWMVNHQAPADQPHNDAPFYWCAVIFFTGLTVFVIGLALGRIGRAGRRAELPPDVPLGERTAQPAVTAPPVVQPTATNGQMVMPNQVAIPGQPVAAVPPTAAVAPVAPTAPAARVR